MTEPRAWVTLLTDRGYLPGVQTLAASLRRVDSVFPLLVMVTPDVDADVRQVLHDEGAGVVQVDPLRPAGHGAYANARFAQVWTKLAVWSLTDYERVVCVDADMLVVRNMDELFDTDHDPGPSVAAAHACRCNPLRIPSYPRDWTPANCHYTSGVVTADYFNAGLLVLRPDAEVFADIIARLAGLTDLTGFLFAEQDFLNDYFRGRWDPLPYVYNALKTLSVQHPDVWRLPDVRNIHFIIDKPWARRPTPDDLASDPFAELNRLWWNVSDEANAAYIASPR